MESIVTTMIFQKIGQPALPLTPKIRLERIFALAPGVKRMDALNKYS